MGFPRYRPIFFQVDLIDISSFENCITLDDLLVQRDILRFRIVSLVFGDLVLSCQVRYRVVVKPVNTGATILELFVEHVEVIIDFGISKGMEYCLILIPITLELHLTFRFIKQINSCDKVSASFAFL